MDKTGRRTASPGEEEEYGIGRYYGVSRKAEVAEDTRGREVEVAEDNRSNR
jgi:hypothetical protein